MNFGMISKTVLINFFFFCPYFSPQIGCDPSAINFLWLIKIQSFNKKYQQTQNRSHFTKKKVKVLYTYVQNAKQYINKSNVQLF